MKRVLTFLAVLLLPLSLMAMTPVEDSTLSDVTGQAGVNINADLTMDINIGTMAWGDSDGIGPNGNPLNPWTSSAGGGYVGVNNFNISNLHVRARRSDNYNSYSTMLLKPITIDVATGDKSTRGGATNTTFVRFGLGALQISMDELSFDVALGARPTAGDPVLNQVMGKVTLGAMDMFINPWAYVDVYAHNGCGVTFDMNVTIDRFIMDYMSWGDTDGVANGDWMTGTGAGYVGLNNFRLGDATSPAIIVTGAVSIDVNTSAHGIYPDLQNIMTNASTVAMYISSAFDKTSELTTLGFLHNISVAMSTDLSTRSLATVIAGWNTYFSTTAYSSVPTQTVVHISFPTDFTVQVAKMKGDVCLGSSADFATGNTGTLGDIYIQGMNMTIQSGSWIDVWAH